jgi:hypothetical protein
LGRAAGVLASARAWVFAYQRPLQWSVARRGLLATAPVTLVFLALCLIASALWAGPGAAHRLAEVCCAYRGWRPGLGVGDGLRLATSAFLLRHSYEVAWTIAAMGLVAAPLEAWVGSRRMLAIIALGHLTPTLAVAASGMSQVQGLGGGGLDVGASAVVVAAAAALALRSRSPVVTGWLVLAQVVDVMVETPLAAAEHLIALGTGVVAAAVLGTGRARREAARRRPHDLPDAETAGRSPPVMGDHPVRPARRVRPRPGHRLLHRRRRRLSHAATSLVDQRRSR